MLDFALNLFNTEGFPPRWQSGLWTDAHGWLHIVSDVAIALAYIAIPAVLGFAIIRRRDTEFPRLYWLFCSFIVVCGFVHLIDATLFWYPWYRLSGVMKLATAVVSWITVIALFRLTPSLLDLPSSLRLNKQLQEEINRRSKIETELRKEREETQLILDSIPSLIFLKDTNNGIIRINRASAESIGRSRSEVEGRHSSEIFPDMADKYYEDDLQVIDSGQPKLGFIERVDSRWVRTDKVPVRGAEDEVSGIIVIATDVTDQRNAEEIVQMAFDATPTGLMTVDESNHVISANASVAKIFGYSPSDFVGTNINSLMPDRFRARHDSHTQEFRAAPTHRQMGEGRELAGLRADGTEFPLEISLRPIRTTSGNQVLASVTDLTERLARDAELKRYAELVEKTSQMAQVGGWEVDVLTQKVIWSDEVCRIHEVEVGYQPEITEAINFYAEDARPIVTKALETAQSEHRGWDFELKLITATGKLKWVRAIGEPKIVDGSLVALTGTFQDIDVRKRTEQRLQLTQAIVDRALDAIIFFRQDGTVLYANETAAEFLRYSSEQLRQLTAHQIDARYKLGSWSDHWHAVKVAGDLIEQSEHQRSDQSMYDCEVRSSYRNIDGQELIVCTIRDTTATNRDRKLREAIFEGAVTGHMLFDERGVIECNDVLLEMFRLTTKSEIIGRPPTDFLPEYQPDGQLSADRRAEVLAEIERSGQCRVDWCYKREDGTEFPAEVTARRVTLESGDALLAVIYDITERERAAAALRRSNEDLKQFAYVASHDLQSPLRGVAGFAGFLKDDYGDQLDETADEYINQIVRGCQRMNRLIQDLLEFSRVDRGESTDESVDLNVVVADVQATLSPEIFDSQAIVSAADLPTCRGDAGQIARLFQNLLSNAIKYHGGAQPKVHIAATETPDAWQLEVSDNGIGIDEKQHKKLFDIFYRLHGQDEYPGTGIGLSICRKIVERHDGRIWLKSQPGEGTTFFFTLPKQI